MQTELTREQVESWLRYDVKELDCDMKIEAFGDALGRDWLKMEAEIKSLREQVKGLREFIAEREWSYQEGRGRFCSCCGNEKAREHAVWCAVGAALAATENKSEAYNLVPTGEKLRETVQRIVNDLRSLCGHPDNWYKARRESIPAARLAIKGLKPYMTRETFDGANETLRDMSNGGVPDAEGRKFIVQVDADK